MEKYRNAADPSDSMPAQETPVDGCYSALREGGLALVRGEVGYILLGHSDSSVERIYSIKSRDPAKPCVVVGDAAVFRELAAVDAQLVEWVEAITARTPIAVIAPVRDDSQLLAGLAPFARSKVVTDRTAAIFMGQGKFVDELVAAGCRDEFLFIGTSGNLSDAGNSYRFGDVPLVIRDAVDWKMDMGPARFADQNLATTVVNLQTLTCDRVGVNAELIQEALKQLKP